MIRKYWPVTFAVILSLVVGVSYGQQAQPPYRTPSTPPRPGYRQPASQPQPGYTSPRTNPPANQGFRMPTPFSSRPVQGAPQVPQAPFKMTPQEQDYVNRVLAAWEKYSDNIKTFEAEFTLRTYGDPFQNTQRDPKTGQQQPVPRLGTLKYEKPDKGYFEVAGDRPKKWICDGTSLYEYSFVKKELVQHVLPPEERGQAILNGPLPFIFGAKAATLKQRYWIRALPSPSRDQIWLQAFPKYGIDASNFCRAEMIVSAKDMHPIGIQMLQPNRKTQESYAFSNIVVNKKKSFVDNLVGRNGPFYPELPRGWTKLVKQPETAQSNPIRTTKR